jgi:tetratricopeptide (TPR) repeat protein
VYTICVRPLLADVAYWRSQAPTRPFDERIEASIRSVRLWPLEPVYRLGLAWNLAMAQDVPAAQAQLAAADRLAPDTPRVWRTWGDVCMLLGEEDGKQYQQAEEAYQKLVELAPNVARYRMARGLALIRQSRFQESASELEQAAALDSTDAIIYSHLADVYWKLGRQEDAAQAKATFDRLDEWEHAK